LGDEPPARVAGDSAKLSPANGAEEAPAGPTAQDHVAARPPGDGAGGSVDANKPPAELTGEPKVTAIAAPLAGFFANYWRWFATLAAVLLLGGAAWMSRDSFRRAARKIWSR
jgi:hypothetical protein